MLAIGGHHEGMHGPTTSLAEIPIVAGSSLWFGLISAIEAGPPEIQVMRRTGTDRAMRGQIREMVSVGIHGQFSSWLKWLV